MGTFRKYRSMSPLLVALVAMGFGGCKMDLTIHHQGIFDIITNIGLGKSDPMEGVTLFSGCAGNIANCAMDCGDCGSCAACDSCSSCDCSSCADCTDCAACSDCGCEIIDHRFDTTLRIPNAAQVRLTSSGLDFIEQSISPLVGGILPALDVEEIMAGTQIDQLEEFWIGEPGGGADFLLDMRDVEIAPVLNDPETLRATVYVYGATTPDGVNVGRIPLHARIDMEESGATIRGSIDCWLDMDAGRGAEPKGFRLDVDLRVAETASGPNMGYGRLEVAKINFDESSLEYGDVVVDCSDSGAIQVDHALADATLYPDTLVNGFQI